MYEHSQYDETGQLLNATLADYLLPMSGEMPDIKIAHVETPLTNTELGANGIRDLERSAPLRFYGAPSTML